MFRLAMLTGFCYVNRPLVRFDRSPAEIRHVGVSSEWNKMEFWLQDSQLRLERPLALERRPARKIRKVIRERLSSVHSGWANWYLEAGQYEKAREAVSKAAQLNLTFNIAVKWLLTWMSPRLALRTVQHHQQRRKDSFYRMKLSPHSRAGSDCGPRGRGGAEKSRSGSVPYLRASGRAGVAAGTGPAPRQAGAVHAAALPGVFARLAEQSAQACGNEPALHGRVSQTDFGRWRELT